MKKVAGGLFLRELQKIEPMQDEASPSANDRLYGFASMQSQDVNPSQSNARMQCLQILQDMSHDIQQLQRYAAVAKLFIKFNTKLPSSAPVQRLFSAAGLILLPRRNCLHDVMFEIVLFLNKNPHFVA